jgi:signal transduction histidine kinase
MSHELRTPLNHIIGFSEILADGHIGKLNQTQEEYLNDVINSSQHLLSLINDVLDLAKIEAAKLDLEFGAFDPNPVLKNSLSMIKEKALKRNINISAELKNIPSALYADERRIKQILYNLLSNSAKFTTEGGWIRLVAETLDMSTLANINGARELVGDLIKLHGQLLYVTVEDSGIGLKEKYLEEIFEPFEQVKLDGHKGIGGTGLGLPLTRDLVELHGGIIWAESEGLNKGSKFSFVIPVNAGSLC